MMGDQTDSRNNYSYFEYFPDRFLVGGFSELYIWIEFGQSAFFYPLREAAVERIIHFNRGFDTHNLN